MKSIIRKISGYNFSSRNGNSIKYIVMHFTGNTDDTALNNANYFGGGNRNASAHYFIDDNNIVQVVEDINASWNCGDGNGAYGITNQNSIAIEMCGTNRDISAATENNTLELVKYLMDKYNVSIDNVVRHYDASRKICPSPWSSNGWSKWYEFKNKLTGSESNADNPVAPIVEENIDVIYQVYTGGRWLPNVKNLEDYAGLWSQPVQGVYANVSEGHIKYRVHTLWGNWLPWVTDRQDYAGILGTNIDGLQMELVDLPGYSVNYRTYVDGRWLPWVLDLEDYAGLYGQAIEEIQVEIIKR
ncbi:N-acetylmuramoyl-L-alanine amidase [Clostridium sp. UBA1056]|uniref:peptidoglycan recognition protein family protein n=1 Tax=unclassified Clostridium TaxID=2614128 RepID=UPI0032178921